MDIGEYEHALARLAVIVAERQAASSIPGLALAITDRDHLLYAEAFGHADLAAQQPLTLDHLFDIASIGKWYTAIALLQLVEAGRLDLQAPIREYLPWFGVRSRFPPITTHHLLTHTAGLALAYAETPGSRFDTAALREMTVYCAPGEHFYYSNTGYKTLGFLLESLSGKSRETVIGERIFAPLGMRSSSAAVRQERREQMAVGYTTRYDDRPSRAGERPMPAPWTEFTTGDGGGLSTASDLAAFARMVLHGGEGVLSPASFTLMARPAVYGAFGQDISYGYGVVIDDVAGHTHLGCGGGAPGYQSVVMTDQESGLGVVVLINHGQAPLHIGLAYTTLQLLRAAQEGAPLPAIESPPNTMSIANAADYQGVYHGEMGTLTIEAEDGRLFLRHDRGAGAARIPLERRGDAFYADHADFALFLLRFGLVGDEAVEVFHGGDWYRHERYIGPAAFETPAAWEAYAGHYRSHNPWFNNFRVVRRKGALLLIHPHGREEPLAPLEDGTFRVGAATHAPERLWFDTLVEGEALRAILSGEVYYRALTP